jgi:hypothetical protein
MTSSVYTLIFSGESLIKIGGQSPPLTQNRGIGKRERYPAIERGVRGGGIEYPKAIFHVIAQGNRHEAIVLNDAKK